MLKEIVYILVLVNIYDSIFVKNLTYTPTKGDYYWLQIGPQKIWVNERINIFKGPFKKQIKCGTALKW